MLACKGAVVAKCRLVLQNCAQLTHIVRVLGDAIRRTRTNVRGVVTHANDSKEEKSEEGPCKEEGQEDETQEEIGLR